MATKKKKLESTTGTAKKTTQSTKPKKTNKSTKIATASKSKNTDKSTKKKATAVSKSKNTDKSTKKKATAVSKSKNTDKSTKKKTTTVSKSKKIEKKKTAPTTNKVTIKKNSTTKKNAETIKKAVKTALKVVKQNKTVNHPHNKVVFNDSETPKIERPKLKSANIKTTNKIKAELPFDIGSYIFYPNDGLGLIESLEKREIEGKTKLYYRVIFQSQKTINHIPVDNIKLLRVRKVITKATAQKVLKKLSVTIPPSDLSWKERLNVYQETSKKGNALEMTEMVVALHLRRREKSLSFQERQYYEFALDAIIGEVSVALNMKKEDSELIVREELKKLVVNSDDSLM